MKTIRKSNFVRSLVLMLGTMALSSGLAAAQSGTFHLPVEVKWGRSLLPAGDYSYSLVTGTPGHVMLIRSLSGRWGAMMEPASLSGATAQKDQLFLTKEENGTFVTAFSLTDIGVLTYNVVKGKEPASTASTRIPRQPTLASVSPQ